MTKVDLNIDARESRDGQGDWRRRRNVGGVDAGEVESLKRAGGGEGCAGEEEEKEGLEEWHAIIVR